MKNYTEELAEWVEKQVKRKRRQDATVVAFLALRRDVKAASEAGYALTTIWEHMLETGKLKCSYETFRKHVRRFLKPTQTKPGSINKTATQAFVEKENKDDQKTKTMKQGEQKKNAPINGFSFNATPNKEDLF
ncbi:MAG: TraK family protein [Candidatus Binatia bacterium]